MKFKMNNRTWEIIETSQEEIRKVIKEYKYDGEPKEGKYFGLTYLDSQKIYIDEDLCYEQKRQTLIHELVHCYIGCYLFNISECNEEVICNITANSFDTIYGIIKEYFS